MEVQIDEVGDKVEAETPAPSSPRAPVQPKDDALDRILKDALDERLTAAPVDRLKAILANAISSTAARQSKR